MEQSKTPQESQEEPMTEGKNDVEKSKVFDWLRELNDVSEEEEENETDE